MEYNLSRIERCLTEGKLCKNKANGITHALVPFSRKSIMWNEMGDKYVAIITLCRVKLA